MDNGASSYRRFLDGDESAFNEIMEELFRSLVFFILQMQFGMMKKSNSTSTGLTKQDMMSCTAHHTI